ncbi:MAG: hypothetical protein JO020_04180 [Chloroflexi bacterium]|nr:hypothetical protein [Chloroflexota bacterium]
MNVSLLRLANWLSNPPRLLQDVLLHFKPDLPLETRLALDLFPRPNYAYGVYRAATQARALGIGGISAVELGVGQGEGLLALEAVASEVEKATGVRVATFGFDLGEGLPAPQDYRDLPYLYAPGYYQLDLATLRARLKRSQLVLGDVSQTVPKYLDDRPPPIGFVAFDLDFYSSTVAALKLFESADSERYLPRVMCYFDDIANEQALQTRYTGELLAVSEFNAHHPTIKIDRITGFEYSRLIRDVWNIKMYVCHFFDHPRYNAHIMKEAADYVPPLKA